MFQQSEGTEKTSARKDNLEDEQQAKGQGHQPNGSFEEQEVQCGAGEEVPQVLFFTSLL